MTGPRAVYRGYWSGGKRAGQVQRLHIIREHGPGDYVAKQTLCGQAAWPCTNSDPVILDPMPARPPDGLSWCPKCIGHLAEQLRLLDEIASSLAGYGTFLDDEIEEAHDRQRAIRRRELAGRAAP